MKSFEQMFFLAGLPRTGSSLLTNILSQNPDILSEGSSALSLIMGTLDNLWKNIIGLQHPITNTHREKDFIELLKNIPHEYYLKNKRKIVIDKNRSWSHNSNIEIIKEYITNNPKIIVMIRPIEEIVKSFFSLYEKNNSQERKTFFQNTDPFISAFNALLDGILYHKENILPIFYSELLNQPQNTIKKIYNFLEIPEFTHNFERIATIFPEGDYHLPGLHEVRTSISKREINIELTEDEKAEVDYFQRKINIALEKAGIKHVF